MNILKAMQDARTHQQRNGKSRDSHIFNEVSMAVAGAPIHDSAQVGDKTEVMRLIESGIDIDDRDNHLVQRGSALSCAIDGGHIDLAEMLIDIGANINVRGRVSHREEKEGGGGGFCPHSSFFF
jgi:ankyrin repeat protein